MTLAPAIGLIAALLAAPAAASTGHADPVTPVALALAIILVAAKAGGSVGASLTLAGRPVVPPDVYSAVVVMVVATTLATPPALRWRIGRTATER